MSKNYIVAVKIEGKIEYFLFHKKSNALGFFKEAINGGNEAIITSETYSNHTFRLSKNAHESLKALAKKRGISKNKLMEDIIRKLSGKD